MTVTAEQINRQLAGFPVSQETPANLPARWSPEAFHAMQERDNELIRDAVLHGYAGKEYVYKFKIKGAEITGISVVGARALAAQYGGIKTRIVASVEKTGSLFVFKSFEPLAIQVQMIPQLAGEDDFYEVVLEVQDIKTGNSIQVRKKESRTEKRQDGSTYDRPHYDVIAESKAFRNGVLSLLPQDVLAAFEQRSINSDKVQNERTLDQIRQDCLMYAARNGIPLSRKALADLTYAEVHALGQAATQGADKFREACQGIGALVEGPKVIDTEGTWPQQTSAGLIDRNGEIYNEDMHAAWIRGEAHPPMTKDGAWMLKRGRKPAQAKQPDPTMPLVSERETQALAWIASAADLQTIDDVEDEVRDEADDVRERVAKAAEAKRRDLAPNG